MKPRCKATAETVPAVPGIPDPSTLLSWLDYTPQNAIGIDCGLALSVWKHRA